MKDFRKKWFISASSGIFGKILLVFLGLGAGYVGRTFISLPIDKDILKGVGFIVGMVVFIFSIGAFIYFLDFLEWLAHRRESENERLQLENENLKLKFQLQQFQRDNDE